MCKQKTEKKAPWKLSRLFSESNRHSKQSQYSWPKTYAWFLYSISLDYSFYALFFLKGNIVFLMYQRPDQSVPVDPLQETITNEERREVLTTTGV